MIAAGGGYSRHEHNANVLKLHPVMTLVHTIANRMYAKQIQFTVTDMFLSISVLLLFFSYPTVGMSYAVQTQKVEPANSEAGLHRPHPLQSHKHQRESSKVNIQRHMHTYTNYMFN